MKHLRSIRVLVIFGALILLIAVPTSAQASAVRAMTKISGPGVFATFQYDQGSVHTIVSVSAANSSVLEPPQPRGPTSQPQMMVSIFRYQNNSDGTITPLLSAIGDTVTFQLAVDKGLASAHLTGSLTMLDNVTQSIFPASVDLTWTATADLVKDRVNFSSVIPGQFVFNIHIEGSRRDAVANGTLTALGSNFTPVSSSTGEIYESKTGSVSVQIF